MDSDCEANVDGDHLQQALMNLLLNAIDASGTNGAVALSMSHSADEVEIRVEDSGPGLTAEQQDRLFEAFYTTKSNGTGLGLAVTKTLLEKMGASIVVSNRNGVGNGTFQRRLLSDFLASRGDFMKARILIVEDEKTARQALSSLLTDEGYEVLAAADGATAQSIALQEEPDLILLDIRLPDIDGLTVLEKLRQGYCNAAVIVMTAYATSSNAIKATQNGAFDYITKPINDEHLALLIRRALEYRTLEREVSTLKTASPTPRSIPAIVGHGPAMQDVYKMIGRVANSDATVLISGESGTGKELVANAIHQFGRRQHGPLIKVNCAAIPDNLLEAELFGHEKGAFTNAVSKRTGRFEQANGGTLFLDEIAELPLALQAKLLRAIQEKTIERLGSNQPIPVDFRLITATAQDLGGLVVAGKFREDLYYRLNVVLVSLPPLRERREDIPLLVQRFLSRSEKPVTIRQDALDRILSYDWPGNVRELENVITRAIVLAPGGVITPECIQFADRRPQSNGCWLDQVPFREGYWDVIRKVEGRLLKAALDEANGNKAEAARILGIQRRLLYEKMSELGI